MVNSKDDLACGEKICLLVQQLVSVIEKFIQGTLNIAAEGVLKR